MGKDVLYETDRIRVTYLHSPEPGKENVVISGEDHELWIKDRNGEWNRYIIQRGILEDLSRVNSDGLKGLLDLANMLNRINSSILEDSLREGIALRDIGQVVVSARKKEEEDFKRYLAEQKRK
ncbi:hypothetical protein J4463_03350 [Candidatus Pacearchaeota archaeon]|nr:hypothetical protein [Candidatus Pacearchaeota archaeon]